jgi:PEP-CTERM motif
MLSLHRTATRLATLSFMALALARDARADFIVLSSRDAFRAAIAGTGSTTEGWDEFGTGTIIPNGALVNGVVYDLSDPTADFVVTAGGATISPPNGLGRTNNPLGGEAFLPSDIVTLTFPAFVTAFGVSFNTFATTGGAYSLTTDLGDIAPSAYNPFPGYNTGQFAGFISDEPVSTVTIRAAVPAQFGLDDLNVARPIPEPASLILFVLSAVGLFAARRVRPKRP